MSRRRSTGILLGIGVVLAVGAIGGTPARAQGPQLAHMVFFTLADPSEESARALVEGCKQYLSGHEGTIHFSVGLRAEEMDRDVNAKDFQVALHLIFQDKAAHDRYQEHPRHQEFIAKHEAQWKAVRVYDSHLAPASPAAAPGRR